jgi:macrolide-specific efflux system membrane fusion protein
MAAGGLWSWLGRGKAKEARDELINPVYGSIETSITATGTVQPNNRLEVRPPVSGRVEKVLVEEGQEVKAGDILALISSTDRAALMDMARLEGAGVVKEWEEVYKAAPLLAPLDAEVIVKAANPGQTVSPSDAVIVLSDRLIVQAQVDETDIGKVKTGQAAVITLDAYPDISVTGEVSHIYYESRTVNNVTIYQVDILPHSLPELFRSGMSASVRIIQQRKEQVLSLPHDAVDKKGKKAYVFVKEGKNKPSRREVSLGVADDANVEIASGLTEDDSVVRKTVPYDAARKQRASSPFMPGGGRGR